MSMAYVLINSEAGCEAEVMKELNKISGVREAHRVYGVYDIIIKVEAEDMVDLKETVLSRVRKLGKVRSSITLICV
ncbi:hypothetical protein ES703_14018 [subsurface metagenome]